MNAIQSFGVSFFLRRQRNKNGQCPIYARISVRGKRIDLTVNRTIDVENWNVAKGMAKGTKGEAGELNLFLTRFKSNIVQVYQELLLQKKLVTPELVRQTFTGEINSEHTLCKLMDYHNQDQKNQLEWGTMKNYMTTQKYVKAFLKKQYGTTDKYLIDLSYRFLTEFEYFLRNLQDENGKLALGNNGVMKHLERFRKMINFAMRLEWIDKNPFAVYQLKYNKVEREFLTREELARIEEKTFRVERLELVKDLFVFSCYTGLAYIDTVNLTKDNVTTGINGGLWLVTQRQKTHNPVKVPLLPKAIAVIEKYRDHPRAVESGALLPTFSNQKLNSYLKEIADICEISKPLTFHIARHTFATTTTLSNGVPIETVSKMLGHSKLTTTQIYAKVIDRKVGEDMEKLMEKLAM